MSFTRARALQSLQNGLRQSSARPALRSNAFRRAQLQAKRFASSEHGHQQSSDLPWLLGALVITPPAVYYLWPSAHSDGHHDDHGDHKDDTHDAKPEEQESGDDDSEVKEATEESSEPAEESKDDSADKEEEKKKDEKKDSEADEEKEEKKNDKAEKKDVPASGEGEAKPAEGSGNVEGVNFKGKVKEGSDAANHSTKVEGDNKGEKKKRIDSGLAKNLTPGHEQEGSDLDQTTQDGKQKGLSNTQTRHSEPIHESDEKSKKPDGTPETSKHMGTVDGDK
ncbi:hypothetical protein AMS68_000206 [Peltaster fructicola]|uniref:Cylicin I n=1 Tax=Peltaster fructicola TaxID=286661 RepID=A0A6H0XJ76_9PEZI|nr:hypothetical protein AMS68_000206 [Peltaster fructicola]